MTASGVREGFARHQATTRRFTLGLPRAFTLGDDRRLRFLRTRNGRDPVTCLWDVELDGDGAECLLVDPRALGEVAGEMSAEERAHRERTRELADGITAYATETSGRRIAFTCGGRLYTYSVDDACVVAHPTPGAVHDARPSPDGSRVAYVSGGALHVLELPSGWTQPGVSRTIAGERDVQWGVAEFIAAEEMGRARGYWWAPDSARLAVARVDEAAVSEWWIGDPSRPWLPPTRHAYPAAGSNNADVRLAVVDADGARRVEVRWDRDRYPYLNRIAWDRDPDGRCRLTVQVQTRDQRGVRLLAVDHNNGGVTTIRELEHASPIELVDGSPTWSGPQLVTVEDLDDHGGGGSRALMVDGAPVTPPGVQVRRVVGAGDDGVVFVASHRDPTRTSVWRWTPTGTVRRISSDDGVHTAFNAGDATVIVRWPLEAHRPEVTVEPYADEHERRRVAVVCEQPEVTPRPSWLTLGTRRLRAALLLPEGADSTASLPVLLDPYGGPHAQRVLASAAAMATSQWLADQGFAVLVIDGRGTPGRGPVWERAIHGELAETVLADQVNGLRAAARLDPRLDLDRVGIRGWSFGGYLAALAAIRAPRAVRAAVVGAPVVDWRLYDTHYTERYLGDPLQDPDTYQRASVVDEHGALVRPGKVRASERPRIMIVHGLADDNVVAAHSLRLSEALLAAGWQHQLLPLPGVTHLAAQEDVAEQLLTLQVDFLRSALGER